MWQLRGRYPNRGYPKIFNDATVGPEAKKLFEEAQEMLADFVKNKRVELNGIVGFYPANSVGDDVEVGVHATCCCFFAAVARVWAGGRCSICSFCAHAVQLATLC